MGTGPVIAPYTVWGVEGKLPLLMMFAVWIEGQFVICQGLTALHDLKYGTELNIIQKGRQIASYVHVWEKVPNTPTIIVPELKKRNYFILKEPAKFLIKELN